MAKIVKTTDNWAVGTKYYDTKKTSTKSGAGSSGGAGAQGQAYTTPKKPENTGGAGAQGQAYSKPVNPVSSPNQPGYWTGWKTEGGAGAQGQAISTSITLKTPQDVLELAKNPQSFLLSPKFEDSFIAMLWKFIMQQIQNNQQKHAEEVVTLASTQTTSPYALNNGYMINKNTILTDPWGQVMGPQYLSEAAYINGVYGDKSPKELRKIIDAYKAETVAPRDTKDYITISAEERSARAQQYQEQLLMLGLLEQLYNIKNVQPGAEQIAKSEAMLLAEQTKGRSALLQMQMEKEYKLREDAYLNYLRAHPDVMNLSEAEFDKNYWQFCVQYNSKYNMYIPIDDALLYRLGYKKEPSEGEPQQTEFEKEFYARWDKLYQPDLDAQNQAINDKYQKTMEAAGQFPLDSEYAIANASIMEAERIAVNYDNKHQVNSPVDIALNAIVRSRIVDSSLFLDKAFAKQDVTKNLLFVYATVRNANNEPWKQKQYAAEVLEQLKKIDPAITSLEDASTETLWEWYYDLVYKQTGVAAKDAALVIHDYAVDPASILKTAGEELRQLWQDKFADPAVLGRIDLVLGNLLADIGEVTDITTYPIKYLVAESHPELFGKTYQTPYGEVRTKPTTEDIQKSMFAATFSETGRENPTYNTGNAIGDIVLESISDLTLLINLGALAATKNIGKGVAKNIAKDLAKEFDNLADPVIQKEMIRILKQQLAAGVDPKTAIAKMLQRANLSNELSNELAKITAQKLLAFTDTLTAYKTATNIIQGVKMIDGIADAVDMTLLRTALIGAGPGIPFMVLKKAIPGTVGLVHAAVLKTYTAYQDPLTKAIPWTNFEKFTEEVQTKAQKYADINAEALGAINTNQIVLDQLRNTISLDVGEIQQILAKLNNDTFEEVQEELILFFKNKFPGEVPAGSNELVNWVKYYQTNIQAVFDTLSKKGISPAGLSALKAEIDGLLIEMQKGLNTHQAVSRITDFLKNTTQKQLDEIAAQLKKAKVLNPEIIKGSALTSQDIALAAQNRQFYKQLKNYILMLQSGKSEEFLQTAFNELYETTLGLVTNQPIRLLGLSKMQKQTFGTIFDLMRDLETFPTWIKGSLPEWIFNKIDISKFKISKEYRALKNGLALQIKAELENYLSGLAKKIDPTAARHSILKEVEKSGTQFTEDVINKMIRQAMEPTDHLMNILQDIVKNRLYDYNKVLAQFKFTDVFPSTLRKDFPVDMQSITELKDRIVDSLSKKFPNFGKGKFDTPMFAMNDTLYRLGLEHFFSFEKLQVGSGWADLVKELNQLELGLKGFNKNTRSSFALINRLTMMPNYPEIINKLSAHSKKVITDLSTLAKQIKSFANITQATYNMQEQLYKLLTQQAPVKILDSTMNASFFANALLSSAQVYEITKTPLQDMLKNIDEVVNTLCEKTESYINTKLKQPVMKLDYWRTNIDFHNWVKQSSYKNFEKEIFDEAHTVIGDPIMTGALFGYLSDSAWKKNFVNKLQLDYIPDPKLTWVYDLETSGLDPATDGIITIGAHRLDDPTQRIQIAIQNPTKHASPGLQDRFYGGADAYHDLITTGRSGQYKLAQNEREGLEMLIRYIQENTDGALNEVKLMTFNGNKFDNQFATRYMPSYQDLFATNNTFDVYTMLQQMHNVFYFSESMKGEIKNIMTSYLTYQLVLAREAGREGRLVLGAGKELQELLTKFVGIANNEKGLLKSGTGILSEMEELIPFLSDTSMKRFADVAENIKRMRYELAQFKQATRPYVIAKSWMDESNINALLTESDDFIFFSAKKILEEKRVMPFFDVHKTQDLLSRKEAYTLGALTKYAYDYAASVTANNFFKTQIDFKEILELIKDYNFKDTTLQKLIKNYMYTDSTPEYAYGLIKRLTEMEKDLIDILPDPLIAAIADKTIFTSGHISQDYFAIRFKQVCDPREVAAAFDLIQNAPDPLQTYNEIINRNNPYFNAADRRYMATQLKTVSDLIDAGVQLSRKTANFANLDLAMHDLEMRNHVVQLLALPFNDARVVDQTGVDRILSHMLYNVQSPLIMLNPAGLSITKELNEFITQFNINKALFHENGIDLIADNDIYYLVLTGKPQVNITNDFSKLEYNGRTIEFPSKIFGEDVEHNSFFYDIDWNKVNEMYPELSVMRPIQEKLDELYAQFRVSTRKYYFRQHAGQDSFWYQQATSNGAPKELISTQEMRNIFEQIPKQVKDRIGYLDDFLTDNIRTGITFNYMNLGSYSVKRQYQPNLSRHYFKRLAETTERIARFGEAKYSMLSYFTQTDMALHLGENGKLSNAFKSMLGITSDPTLKDISKMRAYLRAHPEFTICAVVADPKRDFKLIEIKPRTAQELQEAIRLNAIIVENNIFSSLYKKINFNHIGENALKVSKIFSKLFQTYMVLMKLGWLSNPRTWMTNFIDNPTKMGAETGADAVTISQFHMQAFSEIQKYNDILRQIFKLVDSYEKTGVEIPWERAVDEFFKTVKVSDYMSPKAFRQLHDLLQSNLFASLPRQWTERYLSRSTQQSRLEKLGKNLLTIGFSPISITENVSRLAHYRYLESIGEGVNKARQRVINTYFDYSRAPHGVIDFMFPFYNFMINNLHFWIDIIDQHPEFYHLIFQVAPDIMDESNMTEIDMVEQPYRNMQRATLSLPLSMFTDGALSGTYLKTNFSFMEIFKLMANPINFFENNMFLFPKQLIQLAEYAAVTPDLDKYSIASIWAAAQANALQSSYYQITPIPVQPDEDPETLQKALIENALQFVPILNAINIMERQGEVIERRTGVNIPDFFATMFNTPYHAVITDNFLLNDNDWSTKHQTRTYDYLNNNGEIIHSESLPLEPKNMKSKQQEYAPYLKIEKVTEGNVQIYSLTDTRTGRLIYRALYPAGQLGTFDVKENADGSRTSYLTLPDGKIVWSRTTDADIAYSDNINQVLKYDHYTGELVSARVYMQRGISFHEEFDPETNTQTIYSYSADGELLGMRQVRFDENGTVYNDFDANGRWEKSIRYPNQDLTFEEKDLGNGRYELIGVDKNGKVQIDQIYTKETIMINGTALQVKTYEHAGIGETYRQYQFYDADKKQRITYTNGVGAKSMGATSRKTETYDSKTNTISIIYYNRFGDPVKTEKKSVKFNYLNYQPGSYTRTIKQNFIDPRTGVILTNYVSSDGALMYYRKIIPTSMGKIYEYYDSQHHLTKQVFYPNTNGQAMQEVKSFDIDNNIQISDFYDAAGNLLYTRKIKNDFSVDHVGKIYEYYDANGKLTVSKFYSAIGTVPDTVTIPGKGTTAYYDAMSASESLSYMLNERINAAGMLLPAYEGSEAEANDIVDYEHFNPDTMQIKEISAVPGEFIVQKKASSTKTSHYSPTQYSEIWNQRNRLTNLQATFQGGLANSRINTYISTIKSPFSRIRVPDMNGIYFSMPNFYSMLYTLNGQPRLINNVRAVSRLRPDQRLSRKVSWSLRPWSL